MRRKKPTNEQLEFAQAFYDQQDETQVVSHPLEFKGLPLKNIRRMPLGRLETMTDRERRLLRVLADKIPSALLQSVSENELKQAILQSEAVADYKRPESKVMWLRVESLYVQQDILTFGGEFMMQLMDSVCRTFQFTAKLNSEKALHLMLGSVDAPSRFENMDGDIIGEIRSHLGLQK